MSRLRAFIVFILRGLPDPFAGLIIRVYNYRSRRRIAMGYYSKNLEYIKKWVWKQTESSNFYYQLTPLNRDQLAQLIVSVTSEPYEKVISYFLELELDSLLHKHLRDQLSQSDYGRDIEIEYGRRLGWYAFVRILKPKVVVETGVDHGVGACVLTSALLRNAAEGHNGRYYGTEIRREAGKFLIDRYASVGEILYGDSIESLLSLQEDIDLFINDSDHSAEYEYQEYLTVLAKLSPAAVLLGDNSHVTDCLSRFSREHGRKFIFFFERPQNHWYPGAGIGVSFN